MRRYVVFEVYPNEREVTLPDSFQSAVRLALQLAFDRMPSAGNPATDPPRYTGEPDSIKVGWHCELVEFHSSEDRYDEDDRCFPYEVRLVS